MKEGGKMTEKQYFLYGDYEAERKKPIKELWPGLAKWNAEAMQAALVETTVPTFWNDERKTMLK